MSERPNLEDLDQADLLELVVDAKIAAVRTVIPAEVLEYDHDEQRATVQPVIRSARRDPDDWSRTTYRPAPIPNCPVWFPQGGGYSMTFPLEPGDPVKLSVAARSLDEWLTDGGTDVAPADGRRFDFQDAIVEPGLRSFANALADDRIDDGAAVFGGDEFHFGKANPSNWLSRNDRVEAELQSLKDTLNSLIDKFNSHYHEHGDPDGDGDLEADKLANHTNTKVFEASKHGAIGDTSSDKVKAE